MIASCFHHKFRDADWLHFKKRLKKLETGFWQSGLETLVMVFRGSLQQSLPAFLTTKIMVTQYSGRLKML